MNEIAIADSATFASLRPQVDEIVASATALSIADNDSRLAASGALKKCKAFQEVIGRVFDTVIADRNRAWKDAIAVKQVYSRPAEAAETIIKNKIVAWDREQAAVRARREAELLAEAKREAEELRLQHAIALEKAGEQRAAEQVLSAPLAVAPVVLPAPPKMAGESARTNWRYEIVDESLVPREYLMVDEKKLGAYARAMKTVASVPGVRFYAEQSVASRAGF